MTPLVAAAVPVLAATRSMEWWALGLTVGIGGGVTLMGPTWKNLRVSGLLLTGAMLWLASLLGAFEPLPEALTTPVGALVFAGGMLLSARLCKTGQCERCEPVAHEIPG